MLKEALPRCLFSNQASFESVSIMTGGFGSAVAAYLVGKGFHVLLHITAECGNIGSSVPPVVLFDGTVTGWIKGRKIGCET